MSDLYTDFASDYEWLFADDVVGSSPRLGATSSAGRDLLEAAVCGVGADALALAQRGFTVTATDASSSMIARARERLAGYSSHVSVLQSPWDHLAENLRERFDLAICLGNAIVHTGSTARMTESLKAIRDVLKPDGTVVVDSRNWELMYRSWPRIVPASRAIERHGMRCSSFYIWTIPGSFDLPCRAEIVFLFENQANELSHRRYELTFQPFRYVDLRQALESAGFQITGDSFEPSGASYAITAVAGRAATPSR